MGHEITASYNIVFLVTLFFVYVFHVYGNISFGFYAPSCPAAELMVANTVRSATSTDPSIPGKLLRLVFHDCFVETRLLSHLSHKGNLFAVLFGSRAQFSVVTLEEFTTKCGVRLLKYPRVQMPLVARNIYLRYHNLATRSAVICFDVETGLHPRALVQFSLILGCDASVLLEGNSTERIDPANRSLGGFQVIDSAKRLLEIFCPGTVSCADIIALAARDAVQIVGGPAIQIPTGRRDGRVSAASNVRSNIIDTSFSMDDMIRIFTLKGLSIEDLVTLSGGHTIGSSHCSSFSGRFQRDANGKLILIDTSLDSTYANELMKQCPNGASSPSLVKNDPETSSVFDNQYYQNLLAHKGLFQSDSILLNEERTRNQVLDFANNQESFFTSWSQSFLKLTVIGVKTENEGEIRHSCSFINQ